MSHVARFARTPFRPCRLSSTRRSTTTTCSNTGACLMAPRAVACVAQAAHRTREHNARRPRSPRRRGCVSAVTPQATDLWAAARGAQARGSAAGHRQAPPQAETIDGGAPPTPPAPPARLSAHPALRHPVSVRLHARAGGAAASRRNGQVSLSNGHSRLTPLPCLPPPPDGVARHGRAAVPRLGALRHPPAGAAHHVVPVRTDSAARLTRATSTQLPPPRTAVLTCTPAPHLAVCPTGGL